jgi:hypothetical protein
LLLKKCWLSNAKQRREHQEKTEVNAVFRLVLCPDHMDHNSLVVTK